MFGSKYKSWTNQTFEAWMKLMIFLIQLKKEINDETISDYEMNGVHSNIKE